MREALASSYERTADELRRPDRDEFRSSDLDGAAQLYSKDFAIRDELAKAKPNNLNRQEYLAIVLERMAAVERDRDGDPLPMYRKALEIREKLVASAPANVPYLVGLGNTYDGIGAILADAGCSEEALTSLRKGLDNRRKLVERAPDRADWQAKLAKSLYRLAKCDDHPAQNFAEANEILLNLDEDGKLPEDIRPLWDEIKVDLRPTAAQ